MKNIHSCTKMIVKLLYRLNKIILLRRLKNFHVFFLFKVHADSSLIELHRTLWKNEKLITLLRFNEKSPFLH